MGRVDGVLKRNEGMRRAMVVTVDGRATTEPLGEPGVARQLAAGTSSSNTALTSTCQRISMYARTADIRYSVGVGAQTANATTGHFIGAGERLDLAVPLGASIAVIRNSAATADGVLEVTELA